MEKIQVRNFMQWIQIYFLYQDAFPAGEKKPFSIIYKMQKEGKTDVWFYKENGKFVGLATTINGDNMILLDYLAVSKKMRSHGFGSQILKDLQRYYEPKGLLVEIECVYEDAANAKERKRRKQFYLSNGMKDLQVHVNLFGVDMELVGYNCNIDFAGYVAFYKNNYGDFAVKHIKEIL